MRISARADYAVRAALELAVRLDGGTVKARPSPLLRTFRTSSWRESSAISGAADSSPAGAAAAAATGSRAAEAITVADVVPTVDGPIVSVRGERPTQPAYTGPAEPLLPLWVAVRTTVRKILEGVSPADIAEGTLPRPVREPAAWESP